MLSNWTAAPYRAASRARLDRPRRRRGEACAGGSPKLPPACTAPEKSAVRLLAGRLDRSGTGRQAFSARITSRACTRVAVLFENWSRTGGFTGSSLNLYAARKK